MSESDHDNTEPSLLQKSIKVLAWPLSAAAGLFYGHKYARNANYDLLNKPRWTKDGTKVPGVFNQLKEEQAEAFLKVVDTPQLKSSMPEISRAYEVGVTRIFREKGFRHTLDYFNGLNRTQKGEAIVAFLSAASITMGVALTIADSKVLEKLTRKQHNGAETQR